MHPSSRPLAIAAALAALGPAAPAPPAAAETAPPGGIPSQEIDRRAAALEGQVIAWRRDLHRHPELSNREFRTAGLVAEVLRARGLRVRTGVAHTGVVGVLRGARDEPVVALRADMDALPVTEEVDLPFASRVRARYGGREVGVMHACGHDAHTAILLGVADLLASLRERVPGTVVFLFQPAEERPPPGETGGAALMIEEGALDDPAPGAIFALHVVPEHEVGSAGYRPEGAMASSDRMRIVVTGRQTHAAYPWRGVDPIAVAARIALALQALPAREVDARIPSVVSIGSIHGGVRHNIIPEEVEMTGTIRALDAEQRLVLHERVRRTAEGIAASAGARVQVEIDAENGYPVTRNDPELGRRMLPTLQRVLGPDRVETPLPRTGAEDFGHYARRIPGFYFWLGIRPRGSDLADAAPNHSPRFTVDEAALAIGVRALSHLALDYLEQAPKTGTELPSAFGLECGKDPPHPPRRQKATPSPPGDRIAGMAPAYAAHEPLRNEPPWPHAGPGRVVFLIDACSELEFRILQAWIERNRPEGADAGDCEWIRIPPTRRRSRRFSLERLDDCLASSRDALLAPLRVAWLPRKRGGTRAVRLSDLLRLGDPRDPGPLRQAWILRGQRDRCRIVAGEPAPASELRARWRGASGSDPAQTTGLAEFVVRQASLALERGERRLRGNRYKVPRLVHEDILGRPSFRGGVTRLAQQLGRRRRDVERDASRNLREIAATHSPFVIDLAANLIHGLYTLGYGESLHYDPAELARLTSLSQRYPVVFLPSHKSNLDHLVLQYALHEQGHPPNHTAGGINMNFFPVGPIVRRSGVFFIRRSFKDNPVYKFVLHHYIDFLVEKRFSLEWYIEGGRSRSGKLLPPRFGLLAYVVDAFRRGVAEDVMLIPTSIAYDQIQDVGDYAAEQQGRPKEKESFGWFLRVVKRLRRRYGDIHIRFGEPLALSKVLGRAEPGAEPSDDEENLAVQKLAFEVAARINRATPITPASLVTLALLGVGDQALTLDEIRRSLDRLVAYVRRRELPHTAELDLLAGEAGVRGALDALADNDVVSRFSEGPEAIYRIGPDEQMAAAYYANTVVHFFVNPAIAELSLLRAAEEEGTDRATAFWEGVMGLRDLLKFEFFFSEKEVFRGEVAHEVALVDPGFERALRAGPDAIQDLLRRFRPFHSHRVLRPVLEAYGLVADHLERADPDEPVEATRCVDRCMRLGKQYHLQRRIRSTASVSQVLIRSALRLAENRGLLEMGARDLSARRRAFAEEIRDALRRVGAVDALAASRRARLID